MKQLGVTGPCFIHIVFFTDAELLNLYKAHVSKFMQYRTQAVYHATSKNLAPVNAGLSNFLMKIGICKINALTQL